MQELFFVAHAGEQIGPFSIDEILAKLEAKALDVNDYLYDEASQDWVVLMAYPALSEKMKAMKPSAPPKAARPQEEPALAGETEWFVLKGENKFGPFAFRDVVKMLQEKSVYEFDYVWNANMKAWKRIAEIADFQPEAIRKLKDSQMPEVTEIFFRRRYARIGHGGSILVHDNKQLWKGQSIEISAGGAGIVVHNALLQPGQMIHLHFKPADGLPPFNASCEIVSKKFVEVDNKSSPVQYGVRFLQIDGQVQKELKDFTGRKRKAA